MSAETYAALSSAEIPAGVRSGTLRPTAIAETALARLGRNDPLHYAFTFVNAEGARIDAAVLERWSRRWGRWPGCRWRSRT